MTARGAHVVKRYSAPLPLQPKPAAVIWLSLSNRDGCGGALLDRVLPFNSHPVHGKRRDFEGLVCWEVARRSMSIHTLPLIITARTF